MEVHHHPHVEKKRFKEYFLEFLMIFLAVTMGFFAENMREHFGDREKEREYMRNMLEDLRKDSVQLNRAIFMGIPNQQKWIDSAMRLLNASVKNDRQLYQAILMATAWNTDFHPTERTLTQLRVDGFRVIKNYNTSVAVDNYELQLKYIIPFNARLETFQSEIDESISGFFDRKVMEEVAAIQWGEGFYYDLKLADIPVAARLTTYNDNVLNSFSQMLQRYSFDLATRKIADLVTFHQFVIPAINTVKKEYGLE